MTSGIQNVKNVSSRLVSFRVNSGQTLHLPPKVAIDLMDVEVADNAMITKLVAKGVIAVQRQESVEPVSQAQERS